MNESTPLTEDDVARALGYARVKANGARRERGRLAKTPRRLPRPSLARLGGQGLQAAFA